jgi:uncharacterized repeat protein (TIGR03803 family)
MKSTANNPQCSSRLRESSLISKLRRTGLILTTAALLCDLLGVSSAMASSYEASSLASFSNGDGAQPYAGLVAYDGNLYGTTVYGGAKGAGTIFEISPSGGTPTTLWSFKGSSGDGAYPYGTLVQVKGKFYGTTSGGGASGCGTVFEFTPPAKSGEDGTVIIMHSFKVTDGNSPVAALVMGTDGYFYGTTMQGGAKNEGTVFKIGPTSPYPLTSLYSFCSKASCADGSFPQASLVQYTNGNFYGTTASGGTNGVGTIFTYTPGKNGNVGTVAIVHSFNDTEGEFPYSGLVLTTNGTFYGTTESGGLYNGQLNGQGTIFEFDPGNDILTVAYVFGGNITAYGGNPYGALVEYNGNFYGTTSVGGANGYGTAFEINSDNVLSTLVSFDSNQGEGGNSIVGASPVAGLLQYNGNFYGTTLRGGPSNVGTVFKIVTN